MIGAFLKKINYKKFIYKWCYNMSTDNVLGCWSLLMPKSIFLVPPEINNFSKEYQLYNHLGIIIPTLIHELYHYYQFTTKLTPLLYIICCLPGLRNLIIEPSAYELTDKVSEWIIKIQNIEYSNWQKELYIKYYGNDNYDIKNMCFKSNFNYEYCIKQYEQYLLDKKAGKIPDYYPIIIKPIEN